MDLRFWKPFLGLDNFYLKIFNFYFIPQNGNVKCMGYFDSLQISEFLAIKILFKTLFWRKNKVCQNKMCWCQWHPTPCKIHQNTDFLWPIFSCITRESRKIDRISTGQSKPDFYAMLNKVVDTVSDLSHTVSLCHIYSRTTESWRKKAAAVRSSITNYEWKNVQCTM